MVVPHPTQVFPTLDLEEPVLPHLRAPGRLDQPVRGVPLESVPHHRHLQVITVTAPTIPHTPTPVVQAGASLGFNMSLYDKGPRGGAVVNL